jgi:hypothetical protein
LDDARIDIRRSGNANPHPFDLASLVPTRLDQLSDELNDPPNHCFLALSRQRWAFPLVENLTCVGIRNGGAQVRSAEIHTDIVTHERITLL